jgi:hypothetical protein
MLNGGPKLATKCLRANIKARAWMTGLTLTEFFWRARMNKLRGLLRIGVVLSILTFVSAAPVMAQSGGNGAGTRSSERDNRDDKTDWGWIGLLGLLGLAGLIPKKRTVDVRDNDRTGNR